MLEKNLVMAQEKFQKQNFINLLIIFKLMIYRLYNRSAVPD